MKEPHPRLLWPLHTKSQEAVAKDVVEALKN